MRIIRGLESYPPDAGPSVVALGAFDGIHLAHQKILGLAVERAGAIAAAALACTFDPHPLEVLQPERAPAPITTLSERLDLIAALGIDATVIIPFTPEFSRIEAEVFVKDLLLGILRAREIVVGYNHTFGRGARGDTRLLETLAPRLGVTPHIVPPLTVGGVVVSSSAIREALRAGDMADARRFLGRPYTVAGSVVSGAGRGRHLGFPTANLTPDRPLLIPNGVYAGYARFNAGASRHPTVLNVGYRPTFDGTEHAIEAHLLDFAGDLYERRVEVALVARLREERKFAGADALREQIARDVEAARRVL
jgi:riboflavin kinase / FMN adenylyltransferase